MRLDQLLVKMGLAPSRTKAQELIQKGAVEILENATWRQARASSEKFSDLEANPERVRLKNAEILRYVSRGGLKLEAALRHLKLVPSGWTCLDCGQSTGGFTDCLLANGASRIVGFDVGQGQLHEKLRGDDRVKSIENLHLKDAENILTSEKPSSGFDLIVADLSFIPSEKTLPFFSGFGRRLLLLVKPQFEVGSDNLSKKGIVKDPQLYPQIRDRVIARAESLGWKVLDYFACEVEGRDGNREFFLYAEKRESGS